MPANAALLIGIQTVGGLHHVIIRARASGCSGALWTPSGTSEGTAAPPVGRFLPGEQTPEETQPRGTDLSDHQASEEEEPEKASRGRRGRYPPMSAPLSCDEGGEEERGSTSSPEVCNQVLIND